MIRPLLLGFGALALGATSPDILTSPSGRIRVEVQTGERLTWTVSFDGKTVLEPSELAMAFDTGLTAGPGRVKSRRTREIDQVLTPVVPSKQGRIHDHFRELRLDFKAPLSVVFRATDEGVAYRFETRLPGEVKVLSETAQFRFAVDAGLWFPEETSFLSHQERDYKRLKLSEVGTRFASLPTLVDTGRVKVALTEADLFDYPGMDVKAGAAPFSLQGLFPAYPKALKLKDDRTEAVTEREAFLARTTGTRTYPWRVLALAAKDTDLLASTLVYRLASESRVKDTAWIRPGRVAWDWWNANNVYGVDFRAGVNTATYKHFVDFAAEQGLEYVILDEGWYPLGDLTQVVPELDMPELLRHAKAKGVGLILWTTWKTLDQQFQQAFAQFEAWGVAGIKVDFMQREDQPMVRFYERVAEEAARRHLLVDFHGAYKPTGLRRTFPNVMTHEGVRGLEQNKWGTFASPDMAVTIPFIRMLAGPVDYTPGGMLNAQKKDFVPVFDRPMTQGTRCHQLAMYMVFESPLQMLADSPSNYRKEPESLAFLAKIPAVWDESVALSGQVGEHVLMARRKGDTWFAGALTSWTPRDLEVDTAFLGTGTWTAEIMADGPNADRAAVDYRRTLREVKAGEKLTIHLAPGGGWAARFERKGQ